MGEGNWITSYVPLFLSLIAIFVSIIGPGAISDFFSGGDIIIQNPAGYAILNKTIGNITLYNVVVPIDWINTYKSAHIIVSDVYLKLYINKSLYILPMEGEYPSISNESFIEDFTIIHSLILNPNIVTGKALVFKFNSSDYYIDTSKPLQGDIMYSMRKSDNIQEIEYKEDFLFKLERVNYRPDIRRIPNGIWYYRDLRPYN